MTVQMALFGLVWLLRVRGSLCGCAACSRARGHAPRPPSPLAAPPTPARAALAHAPPAPASPPSEADVVTLEHFTRDVTVQTDFDDDELERIELQICEASSNVGNYCQPSDDGCEAASAQHSPGGGGGGGGGGAEGGGARLNTQGAGGWSGGGGECGSESDGECAWETAEVVLERGAGGLGLSIAGGGAGGDVSVTRLADGGAAHRDGRLHVGDVLLQVNEVRVEGAPHAMAVDALQRAGNVVKLRVRRARRPRVVSLWRGARGLGLGVAGGADDAAGGGAVFVSHVAPGGAAHHDGRLRLGDRILAVRDEHGVETSLEGATHAAAVAALRGAGERVTLVVLPATLPPPVARATSTPIYSQRSQATSCSTLHELLDEEPEDIPRCMRVVRLVRSGSRLGMDIVGGLGGEAGGGGGEEAAGEACGVFVSGVAACGAARGLLHRGDRILSVDGRDLTRATHEQAAAALKYSGGSVTIAAQYQPEQYERLRARIRAINSGAQPLPAPAPTPAPPPDLHAAYPR